MKFKVGDRARIHRGEEEMNEKPIELDLEFLNKDKMVEAVTKLNQFLGESGISAIYCVAAMKLLIALEEEKSGINVGLIDNTRLEQQ